MEKENWSIEDAIEELLQSGKFVFFCGIVSDKKDKFGHKIIEFKYHRTAGFSIEDADQAAEQMKSFVNHEKESHWNQN